LFSLKKTESKLNLQFYALS